MVVVVVVAVAAVQIVQADRTSHSAAVGVAASERHTAVVVVVAWESV